MTTYEQRIDEVVVPALKAGIFVYTNFGELHPGPGMKEQAPERPIGLPDWQIYRPEQESGKEHTPVLRYLQLLHRARKLEGPDWQVYKTPRSSSLGYNLTIPLGEGVQTPEHEKFVSRDLLAKVMMRPVYVIALGRCHFPDLKTSHPTTDAVLMEVYAQDGNLLWVNNLAPRLEDAIEALKTSHCPRTRLLPNAPAPAMEPDVIPYVVPRSGPVEATPICANEVASKHETIFRKMIADGADQEEIIRVTCNSTGFTPAVVGRALDLFRTRLKAEKMFLVLEEQLGERVRPDQMIHRVAATYRLKDEVAARYYDDLQQKKDIRLSQERREKVIPIAEMARTVGLEDENLVQAVVEDSGLPLDVVLPILIAGGFASGQTLGETLSEAATVPAKGSSPVPAGDAPAPPAERVREAAPSDSAAEETPSPLLSHAMGESTELQSTVSIEVVPFSAQEAASAPAALPQHPPLADPPKKPAAKAPAAPKIGKRTASKTAREAALTSIDSIIQNINDNKDKMRADVVIFLRDSGAKLSAGDIRKALGIPQGSLEGMKRVSDCLRRQILDPLVEAGQILRDGGVGPRSKGYRIR